VPTPDFRPLRVRSLWWLLAAILLFALSLRGPIVAPAPVLGLIRDSLGMSEPESGLLTTIPVLCFGLLAPLASFIIRKSGPDLAVTLSLLGILAGTVVRSSGGTGLAVLGTAIIGASITVANVVVPVILHRDFPLRQVGIATGAYTAALNVGSMATSVLMAPLAAVVGWRVALLSWGAVALASIGAWIWTVGARPALLRPPPLPGPAAHNPAQPVVRIWTSRTAWALTLGFGGQGFAYYAVTAWLPSLLSEVQGQPAAIAGASSSIFQITAVAGALGVPILATRLSLRAIVATVSCLWLALPAGLMLAPGLWPLWGTMGGIGQGGGITVIFIAVVRLARNSAHARGLSTMVQGGGYVISSVGPVVFGAIHAASGGWVWPLASVLAAIAVLFVMATAGAAAADRASRR
jgi:MFS transporter, CP family, cyanate transporter